MSRKAIGGILLVLGILLVVVGVFLMFVYVPGQKQLPADVDTVRHYEGTMPVLLNSQTFEFMRDLNVEIDRHVKTEDTDGEIALVLEEQTLKSQDQPLQKITKHYAIDRKTMEVSETYPDDWKNKDGFWDREGLVIGWPMDSAQEDYVGWSDDYRATVPMKFEGEEKHERSGLDTYLFTSSSGPVPIVPEAVTAMGLPTELPKEQLLGLLNQADFSEETKTRIQTLLTALPVENVGLQYYYEYEGKYWIEPQTGVLIDTEKHELRKVGLSDELFESLPEMFRPSEEQRMALRVPVFELTYIATDDSVQDAKQDAEDAINQLELFGTIIPVAAIGLGLILVIIGGYLALRRSSPPPVA